MFQTMESADRIRELLDRNLQEVFGEGDAERRRAAIDELWTEDGILYVPLGAITEHEAISRFAGDLRATHPDFVYSPRGRTSGASERGAYCMGIRPRWRGGGIHRLGCHHRAGRKDRRSLRVP
jgi:hypothetical protein